MSITMADNQLTASAAAAAAPSQAQQQQQQQQQQEVPAPAPAPTPTPTAVETSANITSTASTAMDPASPSSMYLNSAMPEANLAKLRRDSIAHSAGVGGVSWGSVNIGSWLKDEVMFHATLKQSRSRRSSISFRRPSYYHHPPQQAQHQQPSAISNPISPPNAYNAYLPNLEKQYCKDYSCCGLSLPSLHELLRHYEEAHISVSPDISTSKRKSLSRKSITRPTNSPNALMQRKPSATASAAAVAATTATTVTTTASLQVPPLHLNGNLVDAVSTNDVFLQMSIPKRTNNNNRFNNYSLANATGSSAKPKSKQPQQQQPQPLSFDFMNEDVLGHPDMTAFMDMSTHKLSPSSKPSLGNNSNNTLDANIMSVFTSTTNRSFPTQDDIMVDDDEEEDEVSQFNTQPSKASALHSSNRQQGYIDDPARRLYVMDHEEHKPFKCPVIGCEKTYKNQNGLKYHKLHGHQNQKLHENPDGTFSIIDPESNEPFPEGMGYEKDKPYRCEVCGKRYKNLNGLKYHRGHSTH